MNPATGAPKSTLLSQLPSMNSSMSASGPMSPAMMSQPIMSTAPGVGGPDPYLQQNLQQQQQNPQMLEEDSDVDSALRQITGGAPMVQQPPIYDTSPSGSSGVPSFPSFPSSLSSSAAGPMPMVPNMGMGPDSESGDYGLTWPELLRAALLIIVLYMVIEVLPVGRLLTRAVPQMTGLPYGVALVRAVLMAAAYVAVIKFV